MGADNESASIEYMTWDAVARRIEAGAVAILPIGAAAKQHGFHLPLATDRIQAEYFAKHLARRIDALVWPTVTYGYYPAFVNYAGSISLSDTLFENLVHEIARSILCQGCRAVLVLDTGVSTSAPIERALTRLGPSALLHLRVYKGARFMRACDRLATQIHGSHADEIETSLMLALAPHLVEMSRAEPSAPRQQMVAGPLTPSDRASPNYSRSGSYGDPTLATREKGEVLLAALLDDLHEQAAAFITGRRTAARAGAAAGGVE